MAHGLKKKEINDREHGTFAVLKRLQKNLCLVQKKPYFKRMHRFVFPILF